MVARGGVQGCGALGGEGVFLDFALVDQHEARELAHRRPRGERGPELFVPSNAGWVVPNGQNGSRDVRVSIQLVANLMALGLPAMQALATSRISGTLR